MSRFLRIETPRPRESGRGKQCGPQAILACAHCGGEFSMAANKLTTWRAKAKYCSRKCHNDARRVGYVNKEGYRCFTVACREIPEHRMVMEKLLGRPLTDSETVHHRNGDRLDNRPENLELWDSSHPPGQRVEDKIAWAITFLEEHGYAVSRATPSDRGESA